MYYGPSESRPVLLEDVIDTRWLNTVSRRVLRDLIEYQCRHGTDLMETVYGDREDGGSLCARGCITLCISRLRKRLHPGWAITGGVSYRGYRLVRTER